MGLVARFAVTWAVYMGRSVVVATARVVVTAMEAVSPTAPHAIPVVARDVELVVAEASYMGAAMVQDWVEVVQANNSGTAWI